LGDILKAEVLTAADRRIVRRQAIFLSLQERHPLKVTAGNTPWVLNMLESLLMIVMVLATGIEAACVPAEEGGYDYLLRVEPDLALAGSQHALTSDVPADARDVRRVRVYLADRWPAAVERTVAEAAIRPRTLGVVQAVATEPVEGEASAPTGSRPWGMLIGTLVALFLSLGANAYLGMLLTQLRSRYLQDVQQAAVTAS
jgi:hypothetical protein